MILGRVSRLTASIKSPLIIKYTPVPDGTGVFLYSPKMCIRDSPEDYKWSSYRTIINLQDDKITEKQKTLSYFGKKGVYAYRDFVENAAQKYYIEENEIRTGMGENELWLPW